MCDPCQARHHHGARPAAREANSGHPVCLTADAGDGVVREKSPYKLTTYWYTSTRIYNLISLSLLRGAVLRQEAEKSGEDCELPFMLCYYPTTGVRTVVCH